MFISCLHAGENGENDHPYTHTTRPGWRCSTKFTKIDSDSCCKDRTAPRLDHWNSCPFYMPTSKHTSRILLISKRSYHNGDT